MFLLEIKPSLCVCGAAAELELRDLNYELVGVLCRSCGEKAVEQAVVQRAEPEAPVAA